MPKTSAAPATESERDALVDKLIELQDKVADIWNADWDAGTYSLELIHLRIHGFGPYHRALIDEHKGEHRYWGTFRVRLADPDWQPIGCHKGFEKCFGRRLVDLVLEANEIPVPEGYRPAYIDGNPFNCTLANLRVERA